MDTSVKEIKHRSTSDNISLEEASKNLGGYEQKDIPFWIWLIENPQSPLRLPGSIDLFNHDCLHLLLNCGFSLEDEAFVVGFTMGNDLDTKSLHIGIYKFFASHLYPAEYKFNNYHYKHFELGFNIGRSLKQKSINKIDFHIHFGQNLSTLRSYLDIDINYIEQERMRLLHFQVYS